MSNEFNSTTREGPHSTKTDTWLTPQWIIDKIGISYLDPCGYIHPEKGIIVKTAHNYFYENDNGLIQKWENDCFVNPPYSDLGSWLEKMAAHGNGIVLCFARTETKAYQKYVKSATGINFMAKRVSFLNSEGEAKNAKGQKSNGNAPSCLIAYGEENYQRIKNIDGIYCRIDK